MELTEIFGAQGPKNFALLIPAGMEGHYSLMLKEKLAGVERMVSYTGKNNIQFTVIEYKSDLEVPGILAEQAKAGEFAGTAVISFLRLNNDDLDYHLKTFIRQSDYPITWNIEDNSSRGRYYYEGLYSLRGSNLVLDMIKVSMGKAAYEAVHQNHLDIIHDKKEKPAGLALA